MHFEITEGVDVQRREIRQRAAILHLYLQCDPADHAAHNTNGCDRASQHGPLVLHPQLHKNLQEPHSGRGEAARDFKRPKVALFYDHYTRTVAARHNYSLFHVQHHLLVHDFAANECGALVAIPHAAGRFLSVLQPQPLRQHTHLSHISQGF